MYNSRDIDDLRPDVAANCRVWLELCKKAGLQVLVTGTVRDEEYQQQCYRNGTSKSPRPAFHAQGVGLAFDFCRNIKGHEYDDLEFFRKAGEIGEKIGFEWGGRWASFVDRPHLQWSGPNHELTSKDIWEGKRPPTMPLYKESDTVSNTHWADAAYQYLHDKTGMTLDTRDWDDLITRGETMAMIAKALGYVPAATEPEAPEPPMARESEYQKLSSRLHMVKIPIERFKLLMWDKPKKTTVIKDYFNAGYFAGHKEKGINFTLPVANLMADQGDLGEPSLKYLKEWGRVENGKVSCDTRRNASNQFKDKLVSTLIVTGDRAYIDRVNQLPADTRYAVSGIPVIRNGQDVSYSKEVVAEGWDASPLYATWHGMLAVDGSDSIYYLAWQSTKSNLITSCEAWNAFKSYGFTDMILLDGGGSFVLDHNGKNVAVTSENRRINTVGLY